MKIGFIKKIFKLLALSTAFFVLVMCSKGESGAATPVRTFDGSRQSMQNFVTPGLLTVMEDMGLNIHQGSHPPLLAGQYLASELILRASNITTDIIDLKYADTYFTFRNQSRDLTTEMNYSTDNGTESSRGNETVISGNGNYFSVFGKQFVTEDEGTAETIIVVSGNLTQQGITDFQFGLFMLNNHGVSGFIENGQGRLFYDSDNLAEKQ